MDQTDAPEDAAPGWEAIDAALAPLYPGQEPKHVAPIIPAMLGGSDPLHGISAWKRLEPVPHWHFVSYGLTELFGKDWDDPEISGFGFELTFRLACDPADADPPMWAFSLLQNIARYVFQSGNVLNDGEWMHGNGPIALDTGTLLCSLAFIHDPELPAIDTPHGRMAFLQMVGLTLDEEAAAKRWQTRRLLETFLPHMPLWITDLMRPSLLDLPEIRQQVEQGAARDGSSTGVLVTQVLNWTARKRLFQPATIAVELGAGQIEELLLLLALRLPFGRELYMAGPGRGIMFAPGDSDAVEERDGVLRIQLDPKSIEAMRAMLRPVAGSYAVPGLKDVVWNVQQTLIRDAGGTVIRTIG